MGAETPIGSNLIHTLVEVLIVAKRQFTTPIVAFPDNLNREHFGHFLSGFTAGEGTFVLSKVSARGKGERYPTAHFTIELRSDDKPILDLIQAYWQCGSMYYKHVRGRRCPGFAYSVRRIAELARIIVPHFDSYPLMAKKANDFQIWKQGIALLHRVSSRKAEVAHSAQGKILGRIRRWKDVEHKEFDDLSSQLKECRRYIGPTTEELIAMHLVQPRVIHPDRQTILPGIET